MKARPDQWLVAVAALSGCLQSVPPDGVLCGAQGECPGGTYCASDNRCYHLRDLSAGIDPDGGELPDLLCVSPSGCGACSPPDGSQTAVILSFAWQGEEQTYWDGPAATRIALSTRMPSPPTQTDIAAYESATTAGILGVSVVLDALNHYLANNWFELKLIDDPPTVAQRDLLKRDVLYNLPLGYPLVANVISGWRVACYPGGDIQHYVAIVGYDHSGDMVLVADPGGEGAGGAGWSTVTRTYWISIEDLAVWIGGAAYTA